ncbi:hypothetical protein [Dactylosporangium sp. CA-233914]|uniref:hypothetical protein n=1 Tax=Dactylosporangium sp. CA-233914 TaxID=3239934 RepID=UPI003D93A4E3
MYGLAWVPAEGMGGHDAAHFGVYSERWRTMIAIGAELISTRDATGNSEVHDQFL